MPKFSCHCGYVMALSLECEEYELSLIPEENIEDLIVTLDQDMKLTADQFIEKIDSKRIKTLRCPKCERLWLQNEDGSYNSYMKESE